MPPTYPPTKENIEELINRFGPVIVLHPDEKYLPDDPDALLGTGKTELTYGLITNETDYDKFSQEVLSSNPVTSGQSLMDETAKALASSFHKDSRFRYWLNIPDIVRGGNLARARAQVVVTHRDDSKDPQRGLVQLQFWFFYPFNGPGKFYVDRNGQKWVDREMDTCGRHYGDWEHVTLELRYNGQDWKIGRIYLSRHGFTIWVDASSPAVQFDGAHPIIYAARDSHAHYLGSGRQVYLKAGEKRILDLYEVYLYDLTGPGKTFATQDKFTVISSDFKTHRIESPIWTQFEKRWGQYERLKYSMETAIGIDLYDYTEVGSGPSGPLQHGNDMGVPLVSGGGALVSHDGFWPHAFGIGGDGHLQLCRWSDDNYNGGRFQWIDLGVPEGNRMITRAAGATTVQGARPYAFALDDKGQVRLCFNWQDGYNWTNQNCPFQVDALLGVTVVQDERPYMYLIGNDGNLWLNGWLDGQFNWRLLEQPQGSTIDRTDSIFQATTVQGARPYVFARGTHGQLLLNGWWDNKFNWRNLGSPASTSVRSLLGATTVQGERPYAYAVGADDNLWLCCWENDFQWHNLGHPKNGGTDVKIMSSSLGAVTVQRERPYVYVLGDDGHLWLNGWWNDQFNWQDLGTPPYSVALVAPVGATVVAGDRPYVFLIGSDGHLWVNGWWDNRFNWSDLG